MAIPTGKKYKCVDQPLATVASVIDMYRNTAAEPSLHMDAFDNEGVPLRPQDCGGRHMERFHMEHFHMPKRAAGPAATAHGPKAMYDPEIPVPGWKPYATTYPAAIFSYTPLSPYAFSTPTP